NPYNVMDFVPEISEREWENPYHGVNVSYHRLVSDPSHFDADLYVFMRHVREEQSVRMLDHRLFSNEFFGKVAFPMHLAWELIRDKDHVGALRLLEEHQANFGENNANDCIESGIEWTYETMLPDK